MAKISLALTLLILLLVSGSSAPCQGDQNNLIQTGSVSIVNPSLNARQTCTQVNINYAIPSSGFQSAISTNQFSYNSTNGMDYNIKGMASPNGQSLIIIVIFVNCNFVWSGLTASYIISSNPLTWLGSFVGDIYSSSSCNANSGLMNTSISTIVPNWPLVSADPNASYFVQAMISGVRTRASNFNLNLGTPSFNSTIGYLSVSIQNSSRQVELIYVSYFIALVKPNSLNFAFYKYPGYTPSGSYQIVGVSSYNNSSPIYYGVDIFTNNLNCSGPGCNNTCITPTDCNRLNGQVTGGICLLCLSTQSILNGQCVCPTDQSLQNGVCACNAGFINLGGTCVNRCGVNQVWNGSACNCANNYARYVSSVCQPCPATATSSANWSTCNCPANYLFDVNTVTCIFNSCPANSQPTISNGVLTCPCQPNYYSSGRLCLAAPTCPPNSLFNSQLQKCVCSINGQYLINGNCAVCPVNEQYDGNQCQCISGYTRNLGICNNCPATAVPALLNPTTVLCNCPINQILIVINNTSTACVCANNFYPSNGGCSPIPSCPTNSNWDNTQYKCVCVLPNQIMVNNVCQNSFTCPQGSVYNQATLACTCTGANQFIQNNQCVCLPGYTFFGPVCQSVCPQFSSWNTSLNKCQCNTNNYVIVNNSCQPPCPNNAVWNPQISSCQCTNSGYYIINGVCTACPINQVYSNGNCKCLQGYLSTNNICNDCPATATVSLNQNTVICTCPTNQVLTVLSGVKTCICVNNYYANSNGACVPIPNCPAGSTWSTSSLSCLCNNPNYNLVNGNCQPNCPINSQWNSQSQLCTCTQQGYYLINNNCAKCSVNQLWNGSACVCASGFIRTNNICNDCPTASIVSVDASGSLVCTCPNNQVLSLQGNTKICSCPQGYILGSSSSNCVPNNVPTCPPNSNWNGSTLKCGYQLPNQHLIGNTCQSCGNNQGWNGTNCVCLTGYFLIAGSCQTCDINTFYSPSAGDCICNLGFYGNRTKCNKCDSSCGKCLGPAANQCTLCTDVTFKLVNGSCIQPTPCPAGLYSDGSYCFPCSNYCATCDSLNTCNTCVKGFQLLTTALDTYTNVTSCSEVCGKGTRFTLPCDDGNTNNGDGCSSTCAVESGWTCSGGSSTTASTCAKIANTSTIITIKGKVNTFGKILQGITLSNLPPSLTANDCASCSNVLWVKVIQSSVIPSVLVQYQPASLYKYIVQFDFNGLISIPTFTFTVQLNPQYSNLFSASDMAQQIVVQVDPALLSTSTASTTQTLTLDQLLNPQPANTINVSSNDQQTIFGP